MDFGFFHDRPLKKDLIRAAFPFMVRPTVLQDSPDTLTVLAPAGRGRGSSGVKLSFFGGITTGRVGDPLLTRDGMLEVASLMDLMAHNLKVILLRPWPSRSVGVPFPESQKAARD